MKQYSKRTALLHWIIFLLVIATFYLGHELDESKNTAPLLNKVATATHGLLNLPLIAVVVSGISQIRRVDTFCFVFGQCNKAAISTSDNQKISFL